MPASPSRHFCPPNLCTSGFPRGCFHSVTDLPGASAVLPCPFLGFGHIRRFFPEFRAESFLKLYSVSIPLFTHSFFGSGGSSCFCFCPEVPCFLQVVFSECCRPSASTAGGGNLICSDQKLKLGRVWLFDGCLQYGCTQCPVLPHACA